MESRYEESEHDWFTEGDRVHGESRAWAESERGRRARYEEERNREEWDRIREARYEEERIRDENGGSRGIWSETDEHIHREGYHHTDGLRYDRGFSDDEDWMPRPFRRQDSHRHRQNDIDDAYYDSEPDEMRPNVFGSDFEVNDYPSQVPYDDFERSQHRRSASEIRGRYLQAHAHISGARSYQGSPTRSISRSRVSQRFEIDVGGSVSGQSDTESVEIETREWRSPPILREYRPSDDIPQRIQEKKDHWKYDDGTYAETWREDKILFKKDEEIMHPVAWHGKLLALQAQVLDGSSFRDFRRLMSPIHTHDFYLLLEDYYSVFQKARKNISKMQYANACRESFNILVLDTQREQVASLVEIKVANLSLLVKSFSELLDRRVPSFTVAAQSLLDYSTKFLAHLGLDPPAFREFFRHHSVDDGWYSHVPSRERLESSVLYASRAVAFILEFAVISFSGSHLERFDDVYFDGASGPYLIPCDERGDFIEIKRRPLDCLDGFLNGNDVWVFSMTNSTKYYKEGPLYLSSTPEQFAEVWGPMWPSLSPGDSRALKRYVVVPGYIIPWSPSSRRIRVEKDEILCHWTNDIYEIESRDTFQVRGKIDKLLIGARPRLLKDAQCTKDFDGRKFYRFMEDSPEVELITVPGAKAAKKTLDLDNFQLGASFGLPSVVTLTTNFEFKVSTMSGRDPADLTCTKMAVDPRPTLAVIGFYYGVEISACTGNARRITLAKLLSSRTMQELIGDSPSWPHPIEENRKHYFATLARGNISEIRDLFRRKKSQESLANFTALRRSFAFLLGYRVSGKSILALWSHHEKDYGIKLLKSHYQWASLLTDDTNYPAIFIMNSNCLQCTNQIIPEYAPYESADRPFSKHEPYEALSLNRSSVLETTICLKSNAPPPKGLLAMPKEPGFVNPHLVLQLEKGAKFYLSNHRRLEVVKVLENGDGVFVRFVTAVLPGVKELGLKVASLFKKGARNEYYTAWEVQSEVHKGRPWLSVFIMSNRHEIAEWFPIRISEHVGRRRRSTSPGKSRRGRGFNDNPFA